MIAKPFGTTNQNSPERPNWEGHGGAHHHRHRPRPHGDDGADAEAEADAAVGDDEVVGVAHQLRLDQPGECEKDQSGPDHQGKAQPLGQPRRKRQIRCVHDELLEKASEKRPPGEEVRPGRVRAPSAQAVGQSGAVTDFRAVSGTLAPPWAIRRRRGGNRSGPHQSNSSAICGIGGSGRSCPAMARAHERRLGRGAALHKNAPPPCRQTHPRGGRPRRRRRWRPGTNLAVRLDRATAPDGRLHRSRGWQTPMTFEQMKIFVEAARYGSFTHAAEKLGLTQSAVSISIKKLEDRHNVRLFDRSGRRLMVTEAGQVLLNEAERILRDVELTVPPGREHGRARRPTADPRLHPQRLRPLDARPARPPSAARRNSPTSSSSPAAPTTSPPG